MASEMLYASYTKRLSMLNGLCVACIEFILLPVVSLMQPPDPTPLLQPPLQVLHCSYESVRPSAPLRYSRLAVLATWTSPLASRRLVPAVPCDRLHPLHALSTPAATCSVIRHPAGSSQKSFTPLVLTTF